MRACLVILLLTGCASPQKQMDEVMPKLAERCTQMGFKLGTEAHSNCQLEAYKAVLGRPQPTGLIIPTK